MSQSERISIAARRRLLVYAALPLAYFICGRLGLLLAVPPGYATPVFLPVGIAVAAMFMAGAATLPATFFGSLLLNIWIGTRSATISGSSASPRRSPLRWRRCCKPRSAARCFVAPWLPGELGQPARSFTFFGAFADFLSYQRHPVTERHVGAWCGAAQ